MVLKGELSAFAKGRRMVFHKTEADQCCAAILYLLTSPNQLNECINMVSAFRGSILKSTDEWRGVTVFNAPELERVNYANHKK